MDGHIGVHDAGKIYNSYAHGVVTGDVNVGGLAGINRNHAVGTTGLTTSEMTGSATETNMPEFDWSSIWMTTSEYPILRWQQL